MYQDSIAKDAQVYLAKSFLLHAPSLLVMQLILTALGWDSVSNTVKYFVIFLVTVALPIFVLSRFFYKSAHKHFSPNPDRKLWFFHFLAIVLPTEIVRLVISTFWYYGMYLAAPANLIFTKLYYVPSGRKELIENMMASPEAKDYLVYVGCHLLYLLPYLVIYACVYGAVWRKLYRRHDEFMKSHEE